MTDNNSRDLPELKASVRVPGRVLMRRVGEEHVLLNLEDETYYGLNPVGSRLIRLAEPARRWRNNRPAVRRVRGRARAARDRRPAHRRRR